MFRKPPAYSFPAFGLIQPQPAPTKEQLQHAPQAWVYYRSEYSPGGGSYWNPSWMGPAPEDWKKLQRKWLLWKKQERVVRVLKCGFRQLAKKIRFIY